METDKMVKLNLTTSNHNNIFIITKLISKCCLPQHYSMPKVGDSGCC